jgi:hypothetical protein
MKLSILLFTFTSATAFITGHHHKSPSSKVYSTVPDIEAEVKADYDK